MAVGNDAFRTPVAESKLAHILCYGYLMQAFSYLGRAAWELRRQRIEDGAVAPAPSAIAIQPQMPLKTNVYNSATECNSEIRQEFGRKIRAAADSDSTWSQQLKINQNLAQHVADGLVDAKTIWGKDLVPTYNVVEAASDARHSRFSQLRGQAW